MSLPNASRQQIEAMNKTAEEKMKQDGIVQEVEEVTQATPMNDDEPEEEEVIQEDDSQESSEEDTTPEEKPSKFSHNSKEDNIRSLKERVAKAEREREEAVSYIMSLKKESPQENRQVAAPVEEEDPFAQLGLDDESLVEGKHFKELVKEIKNLRSTVKGYEKQSQKSAHETMEVRLHAKFPDFNEVVTQENLAQLREMNPDLADSILSNKDQFKQAKLAYDMVKQMGIYREDLFVQDRIAAKRNSTKPRPLSSIAPTQNENPMSKVNAFANAPLTKELKAQHYQDMLQAMKGL